jgi:hypothetical protein
MYCMNMVGITTVIIEKTRKNEENLNGTRPRFYD